MKRSFSLIFFVFVLVLVFSCKTDNTEDYAEIISVDKIKIDSVKIAKDTMSVGEKQTIKTYSTFANGCIKFYDYKYEKMDQTRNITAYSFTHDGFCTQDIHTEMSQFEFQPTTQGIYTLNFWQDENNSITKMVVVNP